MNSAQSFRPYFQAHTIMVLIDQPIRKVPHKPKTSDHLMKWSVELSCFDIQYRPTKAVKGQAAVDFIAKFTTHLKAPNLNDTENNWVLNVDGYSTEQSSGAGIVLITPNGQKND